MDFINLNIHRETALFACAMPYHIKINGEEKCKLSMGNSITLKIRNAQSTFKVSMAGNAINFHKIQKEIVLYPEYCKTGIINCNIRTKINWLGYLTMGIFQAMGRIELDIEYC